MKTYFRSLFLLTGSIFFIGNVTAESMFAQTPHVISISPSFNQIAATTQPQVSVTFDVPMDSSTFTRISFAVIGERSGYKNGTIVYNNLTKRASFASVNAFNAGERVTVSLSRRIRSFTGDSLNGYTWTFRIPVTHPTLGRFRPPVAYGGGGYGMQCVDMNRDGYVDIVTSSGLILLNNGTGQFNSSWTLPNADGFQQIAVDDFNRDGIMDVVYTSGDGLKIGLGNGAGSFTIVTRPFWFQRYVTADFNNDGYPDIAGVRIIDTTSYLSIALNNGTGQFTDTSVVAQVGGWFKQLVTADIDNDGDLDVVAISQHAVDPTGIHGFEGLLVLRNSGNGIFTQVDRYPPRNYFLISFPEHLSLADFNNDSWLDAEVLSSAGGFVSLNIGGGVLATDSSQTREVWGPELAYPLAVGDFNGDRWIDFVVSGYRGLDTVRTTFLGLRPNCPGIFRGCGGAGYYDDTLGYYLFIRAVQAADVDADGDQDIISVGAGVFVSTNRDTTLSVGERTKTPQVFLLEQNFPNPFNGQTTIPFQLLQTDEIKLTAYNILGEEVRILKEGKTPPGNYTIVWNGENNKGVILPSGIYLVRLQGTRTSQITKAIVLK